MGDIDLDGQDDLVAVSFGLGEFGLDHSIAWFRAVEGDVTKPWTKNYVEYGDNVFPGDFELLDIDKDGDLDIIGMSLGLNRVMWYENPVR